jgi:hypothetical protein
MFSFTAKRASDIRIYQFSANITVAIFLILTPMLKKSQTFCSAFIIMVKQCLFLDCLTMKMEALRYPKRRFSIANKQGLAFPNTEYLTLLPFGMSGKQVSMFRRILLHIILNVG